MLARAIFSVASLLASQAVLQSGSSPPGSVARLLAALKSHDSAEYTQVASEFVIMAAPDFAMPLTFDLAEKAFKGCSLMSIGSVYIAEDPMQLMMKGGSSSVVPTTLRCPTADGDKSIQVDFQADDHAVYVAYPGGMKALMDAARQEAARRRQGSPATH